jgi:hypothetical protein
MALLVEKEHLLPLPPRTSISPRLVFRVSTKQDA